MAWVCQVFMVPVTWHLRCCPLSSSSSSPSSSSSSPLFYFWPRQRNQHLVVLFFPLALRQVKTCPLLWECPSSPPLLLYKHQVADRHSHADGNIKLWALHAQGSCLLFGTLASSEFLQPPGSVTSGAPIGSFLFQCRTAFISLFICRDFNEARCIVSKTVIFVVLPCALHSLLIWNSACQRSSLSLYLLKL